MLLLTGVLAAGCRTAASHRAAADRAAEGIINRHQEALFGQAEAFTVHSPEQQLRRHLMLDQNLPQAFAGSAGVHDLARIPELADTGYWESPDAARPADAWLTRATAEGSPLIITLEEALQIAARNSHTYRQEKEKVFLAALDLDLERDAFRHTWQGIISGELEADRGGEDTLAWTDQAAALNVTRLFKGGARITAQLGLNLVQLLSGSRGSSLGIIGDASISVPLMRGSGRFVVTEPLKQAERNVIYALYEFERFKSVFAVRIAADYLNVLERRDRVQNAEENYRSLVASAGRARRMADMGRLPEIQVDQAMQDELRARERWIAARQSLARGQDLLKQQLGLPVDALVEPDPADLEALGRLIGALAEQDEQDAADAVGPDDPAMAGHEFATVPALPELAGPAAMAWQQALETAFDLRLDLRVAIARLEDAQRRLVVGADALRADLTLTGGIAAGESRGVSSADAPNAQLRLDEGRASSALNARLPWNRRRERNQYRAHWIALERSVRDAQQLEDQIKLDIRDRQRVMLEARESVRIQARALEVARRRVRGTDLFLEQGRAQIRDLLEARESLVSAENALTAAVVRYRVAELEFRRDLGTLRVDAAGLWTGFATEQNGEADES